MDHDCKARRTAGAEKEIAPTWLSTESPIRARRGPKVKVEVRWKASRVIGSSAEGLGRLSQALADAMDYRFDAKRVPEGTGVRRVVRHQQFAALGTLNQLGRYGALGT